MELSFPVPTSVQKVEDCMQLYGADLDTIVFSLSHDSAWLFRTFASFGKSVLL